MNTLPIFASGLTDSPGDIRRAIREGMHPGVTALSRGSRSLSLPVRVLLTQHLANGGSVFVDSGAFTDRRAGRETDWSLVFAAYRELANNTEARDRSRLFVVAPDIVGDVRGTQHLQTASLPDLAPFLEGGCSVILPVQRPLPCDLDDPSTDRPCLATEAESIPFNWSDYPNAILGVPFNDCAWGAAEVTAFIALAEDIRQNPSAWNPYRPDLPARLHLLGGGTSKVEAVASILPDFPAVEIGGDSLFSAASARRHTRQPVELVAQPQPELF